MSESGVVELAAGELSLGVVPEIGGSVSYFRTGGVDLLRPLSAANLAARNVLGVGMFPMMPYANRIAGNAFEFGGKTWTFAPNNPPEKFNVHGTGWHLPWRAEPAGDALLLSLERLASSEPYAYVASQLFALSSEGLRVTLGLTNRGRAAMPFGFGLHPWFERDPDVVLKFAAGTFYMEGPEGIATERLATPPELDFSNGRPLPDTWRNNDYGGWDGVAEIRFPARGVGLRIEADPIFGHLMLYADPGQAFFCVEPQSNAPTAFNRIASGGDAGMGTIVLEPEQSLEGSIAFLPFRL